MYNRLALTCLEGVSKILPTIFEMSSDHFLLVKLIWH